VPLLGNDRNHGKLWLQTRSVVAGWQFIQELKLETTFIAALDSVRLHGFRIESVRNLDQHVLKFAAHCFYPLRQLRLIRRSMDAESTATLVRAFVVSRVDYCSPVLAGAPMALTDKLQRVLNAAASFASVTSKYDRRLSQLLYDSHTHEVVAAGTGACLSSSSSSLLLLLLSSTGCRDCV